MLFTELCGLVYETAAKTLSGLFREEAGLADDQAVVVLVVVVVFVLVLVFVRAIVFAETVCFSREKIFECIKQ